MNIIFTYHSLDQIERRGITEEEVIDAIKYSDITLKKHGKYLYRKRLNRGAIEVCCERTERDIKVITIYWE